MRNFTNNGGIKSKERVRQNGEVFTPHNIVEEMLDLGEIGELSRRIETTFLEPSCGNGNFIVEILYRKLCVSEELYSKGENLDLNVIKSVSTIYGVDIMPDNIRETKDRMESIINDLYSRLSIKPGKGVMESARHIIDRNIIVGNMLSRKMGKSYNNMENDRFVDSNGIAMVINKWQFSGERVKRTSYNAEELFKDENEQNELNCDYSEIRYDMLYTQEDQEECDLAW